MHGARYRAHHIMIVGYGAEVRFDARLATPLFKRQPLMLLDEPQIIYTKSTNDWSTTT